MSKQQLSRRATIQGDGAAGCIPYGMENHLWVPNGFDLSTISLRSLIPYQKSLTIMSNTDVANAEADDIREFGGDHYRTNAVFHTQAHPKRTEGPDIEAGVSLDQLYAKSIENECPIPSLQLCIEGTEQTCGFGYSCVYTDCISWASANKPLPMIRNPRIVFDELHSVFGKTDRSILDWLLTSINRFRKDLGPADQARLSDYLEQVREVELRIERSERLARGIDSKGQRRPEAGIPPTFTEHVQMMFDLQLLAFKTDTTRVVSFKLGRDNSNRNYPESGFKGAFHPTSHHGGKPDRIRDFAKLNDFHVGSLAYFLNRLKGMKDGDSDLLNNSLILYGSGMGDSDEHNHKNVPFFLAGHAGGKVAGGRHIKAPKGTPLANAMLGVLHRLGLDSIKEFGDSEAVLEV